MVPVGVVGVKLVLVFSFCRLWLNEGYSEDDFNDAELTGKQECQKEFSLGVCGRGWGRSFTLASSTHALEADRQALNFPHATITYNCLGGSSEGKDQPTNMEKCFHGYKLKTSGRFSVCSKRGKLSQERCG